MQVVRLYDPDRRPESWMAIIRPGQLAAFSTLDSGVPCDAAGVPFPSPEAVTCLIFDSLSDASAFCQERVQQIPTLRFEVFDSAGRAAPPLLTIVHPSRAAQLEGRRAARFSNWTAAALASTAPFLIWFDWAKYDGVLVLPTVVGLNFLVIAARIALLNTTFATAERRRRERLSQHLAGRREPAAQEAKDAIV